MLGLRVCRLGIVFPEIYAMQVRAIFEAACELKTRRRRAAGRHDSGRRNEGRDAATYDAAKAVADAVSRKANCESYQIGTMIELPRACVVADKLAEYGRVLLVRYQRPHANDVRL